MQTHDHDHAAGGRRRRRRVVARGRGAIPASRTTHPARSDAPMCVRRVRPVSRSRLCPLAAASWQLLFESKSARQGACRCVAASVLVSSSAQQVQSPESDWGRSPNSEVLMGSVNTGKPSLEDFPRARLANFPPSPPSSPAFCKFPIHLTRHGITLIWVWSHYLPNNYGYY